MKIQYKPNNVNKVKGLRKRTSLEKINKIKLNRPNYSGKGRRINILAKDIKKNVIEVNNNNEIKKEKSEIEINKNNKNYDELSDYEYREMLGKKVYFNDILSKLEKSTKEAQKMYQRKIRDMNIVIEKNENRLKSKKNENALLKIEIDNLSKLLAITEEEHKLMNDQNIPNLTNKNNKNITLTAQTEKELESQKEYLSPEYYPNEKNNILDPKTTKEKSVSQTNTNTDVTRNEILNDLKALNSQNLDDPIQDSESLRKNKLNNVTMKFPDLSNIEENVSASNLNNEEERNKIIDDIKKKYNINSNEENYDSNLDKIKNKNYYEHENALDEKIDEKNENDNYGDDNDENNLKYEYKENNDENINNEEEEGNNKIEQFEEDSLGDD